MQTSFILTLALVALVSFRASATEPAAHPDSSCRGDLTDPYDLGWRSSDQADDVKGICLNASAFRSITVVSETQTEIVFANFRHRNQFWLAHWMKSDLPRANAYFLNFSAGVPLISLAHAQMQFQFPRGLLLTSQNGGTETDVIHDVIVSWETVYTRGDGFGVLKTIRKNYPIVGRVLSTEASVSENVLAPGVAREMVTFPLGLTPDTAARLFELNLTESSKAAYSVYYRLLSLNCATQMFRWLDAVTQSDLPTGFQRPTPFHVSKSLDPVKGPAVRALLERRFVTPETIPHSVNQDYQLQTGR